MRKALSLQNQNNFDLALDCFVEALSLSPSNQSIKSLIADCYALRQSHKLNILESAGSDEKSVYKILADLSVEKEDITKDDLNLSYGKAVIIKLYIIYSQGLLFLQIVR